VISVHTRLANQIKRLAVIGCFVCHYFPPSCNHTLIPSTSPHIHTHTLSLSLCQVTSRYSGSLFRCFLAPGDIGSIVFVSDSDAALSWRKQVISAWPCISPCPVWQTVVQHSISTSSLDRPNNTRHTPQQHATTQPQASQTTMSILVMIRTTHMSVMLVRNQ
jgi:hypothetical protein